LAEVICHYCNGNGKKYVSTNIENHYKTEVCGYCNGIGTLVIYYKKIGEQ